MLCTAIRRCNIVSEFSWPGPLNAHLEAPSEHRAPEHGASEHRAPEHRARVGARCCRLVTQKAVACVVDELRACVADASEAISGAPACNGRSKTAHGQRISTPSTVQYSQYE